MPYCRASLRTESFASFSARGLRPLRIYDVHPNVTGAIALTDSSKQRIIDKCEIFDFVHMYDLAVNALSLYAVPLSICALSHCRL